MSFSLIYLKKIYFLPHITPNHDSSIFTSAALLVLAHVPKWHSVPVFFCLFLLTDDDGVVVCNEHLAVHIYEFSHQSSLQLSMGSQTSKRDVIYPLIPHCRDTERANGFGLLWIHLPISFDVYAVEKDEKSLIINRTICHSSPVWLFFSCRTWKRYLEKCLFPSFLSIQLKANEVQMNTTFHREN